MSSDPSDRRLRVEALDGLVQELGALASDSGLAHHWPELADHPALVRADAAITAASDAIGLLMGPDGDGAMDDLRNAIAAITEAARAADELRCVLDAARRRRQD